MEGNTIQLNSAKSINSVNVDIEDKLSLESKSKQITEYDILDSLLVAQQADLERQESLNFRLYGRVDYFSILHRLKMNFTTKSDFFSRTKTGETRNLFNNYDVYVVSPFTGNTSLGSDKYILSYKVVAKYTDIDLMYGGFGLNIFGDKNYLFSNGLDINTFDQTDSFNKPITKLYLFFNYKPLVNGQSVLQTVQRKDYNFSSDEDTFNLTNLPYLTYNIGDIIYGDLVTYQKENFLENMLNEQEYYVTVPYDVNSLRFKYKPFLEIKLRDFSSFDTTINISAATISDVTIPDYAVKLDNNGNYLWRELLDFGFIEPLTSLGVDYPFINGSHYVYSNLILDMVPDMTHLNTFLVFNEIRFGTPTLINNTPTTDVNGLGQLC